MNLQLTTLVADRTQEHPIDGITDATLKYTAFET